jgi:hypothetical protein
MKAMCENCKHFNRDDYDMATMRAACAKIEEAELIVFGDKKQSTRRVPYNFLCAQYEGDGEL